MITNVFSDYVTLRGFTGSLTVNHHQSPLLFSPSLLFLMQDLFELQEELVFLLLKPLQFLPHLHDLQQMQRMCRRRVRRVTFTGLLAF